MPINRKILKANAKQMMGDTQPAVWGVTLVFLLATVWLSKVVDLVNPVRQQMESIYSAMQQASINADQGAMLSAMYQMQALARTPGFTVAILVSVLIGLYSKVVGWGYTGYSLRVTREGTGDIGDLFSRFYMAGKIIGTEILQGIFVFLWALAGILPLSILAVTVGTQNDALVALFLFIGVIVASVLAIIAAYRYAMIPYILLDDPDCPIMEAFRRSKSIMKGRKGELFVLELSFFGWSFLAILAVGLATAILPSGIVATVVALVIATACNLFLVPYQQLTFSQWYDEVRPQPQPADDQGANRDELY